MPATYPFTEPRPEADALVESLARWLQSTSVHCALGLLIGGLATRFLRRRQLHWSWGAAPLAAALLIRPSLGSFSSTLAVAGISATAWGRRWHREDLQAGADLARHALGRRGPLDALRVLLDRAALRRRAAGGARGWLRGGELIVGADERSHPVSIPFGGCDGTHTLVVGATGSGKTVTQAWLAVNAIAHEMGAVVVDPKGDRAMRDELHRAALGAGRRFLEWSPDGESVYNPYARGSETEIADKLLAGERFTEPHYMRQAQRYIGHVVRTLRRSGLEVSLRRIVDHLDPQRLELLARSLPETDAVLTHDYLDSLSARQHRDLSGVRDRLAILTESDVGRWLDPETKASEPFDLLVAVQERAVAYFSLESDSRPLLSEMLGAAIIQDLQTTVAARQARPVPTLVVIDEFSALAAEQVVRLFGRARSAGFSVLLGTQEIADLRLPGRERLLEQVLGNLSTLIAHRQVVPDSAELVARMSGTRGAWRTAQHSDGRTTRTRTGERVLDPDRVMSLATGWAAVIVLGEQRGARVAKVISPAHAR
jgi:type IV secretory pathway TraG/TraD family ATPase VirD4